jgi:GntR family transcriptional regulator, transcriptional repressor for pyruvate dehydrogenase complex
MKPGGAGPHLDAERPENGSRVVADILMLIEQRRYLPGERLPSERDLAERFSVGRGAIREAVTMLESMRYVERRPGSGIFRCREPEWASLETLVLFADLGLPIEAKTNAEVIEVRRMIEVQAIGLACERRQEDDIERLKATLARFRDVDSFGSAAPGYDQDFHMNIFRATHNDVLVRLVTPFYIMARKRREIFFKDRKRRLVSHEQHLEMLESIVAGDKAGAARQMAAHIGRVEGFFRSK